MALEDAPLDFRLLGPLEVLDGDRLVSLGGVQAALAAGDAAAARERGRLNRPPDRRALGRAPSAHGREEPSGLRVAAAQGAGWRRRTGRHASRAGRLRAVESSRAEFDLARVRSSWRPRQRGSPPETRLRRGCDEALALWRGPPLADLAYEPVRAGRDRAAGGDAPGRARAAGGRRLSSSAGTPELVGELEALVRAHPLRERFRCPAHARALPSARQAEALAAYRAARRELSDGARA